MIKVHCIAQEYWHIRKQICECGGGFELLLQKLENREGIHVDVHDTSCRKCGMIRGFVFDISSFFNPLRSIRDLAEVEAVLKKVYPWEEILMRMASPMDATLIYLNQLAESRDLMALEYIAEALYAVQKRMNGA